MGAVATIFPTFTGTLALPNQVFITQTRETELRFSHDVCSLRRGLFLKDTAFPQPVDVDEELCCGLRLLLCCVFAANASDAIFDFVTGLMVSSVLVLFAVFFIKPCASAFSVNQSLKSIRVGFTQCLLTLKSDHDSFMLCGSF